MKIFAKAMLVGAAVLLGGCAGPSTRVLPRVPEAETVFETPEELPVLEEVNAFYLQEELNTLTAAPRPSGSDGESDGARYIEQLLKDYGYQVVRQRFRNQVQRRNDTQELEIDMIGGTNVVATRTTGQPGSEDSDILLILTHHDSSAISPGANDNASGTAAFLEIARLLSKLPTDTELRFVSLAEYGDEWFGSYAYLNSLTKREKERIIGAIYLDKMGHVSHEEITLGTVDGNVTMLSEELARSAKDVQDEDWIQKLHTTGCEKIYAYNQIPVVTVMQEGYSYEDGTPLDRVSIVDTDRIAQVVDVVTNCVSHIMSVDTPSMTARAHHTNDLRRYGFWQQKNTLPMFGSTLEEVEKQLGMKGILKATNTDSAGRNIENYQFPMKWFGVDQLMVSNYYFSNGGLHEISIEASEAGADFDDMKERITSWYGEPVGTNQGPNGTEYDWSDGIYHKFFALIPRGDGFSLEVREYDMNRVALESRSPQGTVLSGNKGEQVDPRRGRFMELFQLIFPEETYSSFNEIRFFTDGVGQATMIFSPLDDGRVNLEVDLEDMLPPDDEETEAKTIQSLIQNYGVMFGMNECWENYETQFPDEEAALAVNQEIPPQGESFGLFVLCEKPEDEAEPWADRVNFFYGYEPLVSYRDRVRAGLQ